MFQMKTILCVALLNCFSVGLFSERRHNSIPRVKWAHFHANG